MTTNMTSQVLTASDIRRICREVKKPDKLNVNVTVGLMTIETCKAVILRSLRGLNATFRATLTSKKFASDKGTTWTLTLSA